MVGTILYSWYVQTSIYMEKDFEVEFRFLAESIIRACVPRELDQVSLR